MCLGGLGFSARQDFPRDLELHKEARSMDFKGSRRLGWGWGAVILKANT